MSDLAEGYREQREKRNKFRRNKMSECDGCGLHDGYKCVIGEKCPRCGTQN